jgi:hypothetical protein
MVIRLHSKHRQRAALMTDLMVSIALLSLAILPIAYSFQSEKKLARGYYERAVAMEIVDGEMESLLAGDWRKFQSGTQNYPTVAQAATNLSDGKFLLTLRSNRIRLEWQPKKHHGGAVVREVTLK